MKNWIAGAQNWLQEQADAAFAGWLQTRAGQRWKMSKRKGSPYLAGFSLPDWHHAAIAAIGANDEETFKLIRLTENFYEVAKR